ncbi:MAG: type II toxin-antitoxin system RelE/ParE family toxin [Opitutus sp.]|nr:type II toxin-antitoxin system RelE/ParE family toxin [Opitutus sp.]
MSAATQIYSRDFDADFLKLTADLRTRIEAKIDDLGSRLDSFPHMRLTGHDSFRIRIGDYRVVYDFDATKGVIHLLAVGHRREVYRT